MDSSIEAAQIGGTSKPKPGLAPKPRLTPKPFSLQKNTTIRSIHAPKTVAATSKTATQRTGKSEATGVPKPPFTTPAQQPPRQPPTSDSKPSSVSVRTKDQPKTTKESKASPHGEDTLDSSVGKSDPATQTAPPKVTPKPIQKDDAIQTNHRASTDIVTNTEQKDEKKKEDETETSVVQKPEESGSDVSSTANPAYRWGSTRKRLSMELTSKFESGGLSLPPQPTITMSATSAKDDANKPEPSDPEQNQTTSEPSNRESDERGLKEDLGGGGSIKRRISLLFDSSSRPEVITKREEPEMINDTGGVKEKIKNWATETTSKGPKTEKKPPVVPRTRSKSFELVTAPTAEKTPKMPPGEPPATETSSQAVDLPSKVSPAEQSTETPMETSKDALTEDKSLESSRETSGEHIQNKSTEGDIPLRNRIPSTSHTAADEGESAASEIAQQAPKRDNVKRRSVRFGVVERDDGGPPLILGSESDSSTEEEEEEDASENEAEEGIPVSVPVYKRVLQKKDDEKRQEEERLKHLEFEKRRRAEEIEQARLKLEEEQKRKEEEEEEEREKEKARQREQEERERERLKEEEMERHKKEEWERERLKEEERERERMREEEIERERQMELMWQRQKEEERERAKQKEERLKQDQEEREKERLKEEERKEERLREERERKRLREEEKRPIHEQEEHRLEGKLREEEMNKEKQREEEWEKEWVNKTERLTGEEKEREREKELDLMWQRQKEEDREKARQKEERLKQEEREKERLREEAEERERERQRRLKEQQEKEKEMERMRQIQVEKQREEERREEERKRKIEQERLQELERKMQEELERKQAQELEEKLRIKEDRERDALTNREQESAVDKAEPNLISFDSEDVPQKSESLYSPLAKTFEPTESLIKVVYDDFSVRPPLIKVDFDDFSVKPKRWGSQAKVETSPVIQSWAADPVDKEEVEVLVPLNVSPWENKVPEQVEKPDSPEPFLAQESPTEEEAEEEEEEEEQRPEEELLISMEVEEEEKETEREEEEETQEDEVEEEDKQEAQVNSYCTNGEDKDTVALIDDEPDQQNEDCEQTSGTDSPKPVPDQVPEVSAEGFDTTDFHKEAELAPFPESSTPLLDTSAQRLKADLGKRRIRTRPSRLHRAGLGPTESPDWRTRDSTDKKEASSKQRESDSEEEQPKPKIVCSPPPTSQRVPMFPGLSPAALIAQLKKRTGGGETGGGEEKEEDKGRGEKESQNEEVAPSPSQLSRSPRSAAHLAGAARVLPPLGGTDGGAVSSPAWLKELKSKKRLSQYDSET